MNELVSNLADWWYFSARVTHLHTRQWLTAQHAFVDRMWDAFADLAQSYGTLAVFGVMESPACKPQATAEVTSVPFVQQALAHIDRGGYAEAVARVGALLGQGVVLIRRGDLRFIDNLMSSDQKLSQLTADEIRRLRDEQLVIAGRQPEKALRTLPKLLRSVDDRQRMLSLLAQISHLGRPPNARRKVMLERIQAVLTSPLSVPRPVRESIG